MRILVTGADGFVGRYLVDTLCNRGHEVVAGMLLPTKCFGANENVQAVSFNLLDKASMQDVLKTRVDGVIHLAAQSMVQMSWTDPAQTINVNVLGTIYLVETIKELCPDAKLITIGSSEEYGSAGNTGIPLSEDRPCLPQNPYAVSKFAAGQIALQMALKHHLQLIHVRPFNHFGPAQRCGFVISDFASQIADIEAGRKEPILFTGDLSAQRDFTDVRDVVHAYALLMECKVENGIYNVCSSQPRSIESILDFLLSKSTKKIAVRRDMEKLRPSNVPLFAGSNKKIVTATGWHPVKRFEESVCDTLHWWREQASK